MKTLFIFTSLLLVFTATNSFAQKAKVRKAKTAAKYAYKQLGEAKASIDLATINDKTKKDVKTWLVRGDVYFKIAVSSDSKFKSLAQNPIDESFNAYKRAKKLDRKGKHNKEIMQQLSTIKDLYRNEGIESFSSGNYKRSFTCFENVLEVGKCIDNKIIDTIIYYNLALVAELNNDFNSAIDYYNSCIDYNYGGPKVYNYKSQIKLQKGDTTAFIETLKKGINNFPSQNDTLLLELINFYISSGNNIEAIGFLSKAILKDPTNKTFYFAQGALYDQLHDYRNATSAYENAILLDSNYFDPHFNLGALYFNKGASLLKDANNIPPSKQFLYDETISKSHEEFKKALPYLESALRIKPKEKLTVNLLKDIYLRLRTEDKIYMDCYNRIVEIYNSL